MPMIYLRLEHENVMKKVPWLNSGTFDILYREDHKIVVRFENNRELVFSINDWLTPMCVARIALEAP